ncbi:hypothetical protein VKT23_007446 [Stygiomarasmius scandens]|uniref:Protein kinase domain-containing protein n=1 Tax=Marasmiellus scandens TaxID=2682957 RepID=A0ABR1JKP8_9AGAR
MSEQLERQTERKIVPLRTFMWHGQDEELGRPLLEDDDQEQEEIELTAVTNDFAFDLSLSSAAAQDTVDKLDQVVNTSGHLNVYEYGCKLRHLSKACEIYRCLPAACVLQESSTLVVEPRPLAQGGFADVHKGSLEGVGQVAVKKLRTDILQQHCRSLFREAVIWKHCNHKNIVPFIAAEIQAQNLCLISLWMIHGNVVSYLRTHPDADIRPLILNVFDGLAYLHDMNIIHGDLKGANILVNEKYEACLSDFGMSSVYRAAGDRHTTTWTTTTLGGGSARWLAPELLFAPLEKPSFASDAYAFGVVIWEILTCQIPYSDLATDQSVMLHVSQGLRPCSRCVTDVPGQVGNLIELMDSLWSALPQSRPRINSDLRQEIMKPSSNPHKLFQISWLARCFLILPSLSGIIVSCCLNYDGPDAESPTLSLSICIPMIITFVVFAIRYFLLRTFVVLPVFYVGPSRSGTLNNIIVTNYHLGCTFSAVFLCCLGSYLRYADIPETWGPKQGFRRPSFVLLLISLLLSVVSTTFHDVMLGGKLLWIAWLGARGKLIEETDGDKTRTQLHVSNVGPFVSKDDIKNIFEASGEVEWVSMHRAGNHCIVQYCDDLNAERILASGDFLTTFRISRRMIRKLQLEDEGVLSEWKLLGWRNLSIIFLYMKLS